MPGLLVAGRFFTTRPPGKPINCLLSSSFSHSVVSDSLQSHGLQHARLPCPSPSPRVAQTHVHWVGDAIQPSHPLSSPSPPAFNLPTIRVSFNGAALHIRLPKYWNFSFSISPNKYSGWFPLGLTGLITLQSKRHSRVFSSTAIWKHQFFGAQLFLLFSSHIHIWLLEKTRALTMRTFVGKVMSLLFKNAA